MIWDMVNADLSGTQFLLWGAANKEREREQLK